LSKAEEYYREALAIRDKLAPGGREHGETLAALAWIMWQKEKPDAALTLFVQAFDALEGYAARLGGAEEDRYRVRARYLRCYRDYAELLIAQKQPARAFEVVERSRARSLLEILAAAHIDIHQGVDPELVKQEHSLQALINAKSSRR